MKLNINTEKALKIWICTPTWNSNHPNDMDRFFNFVNEYSKNEGLSINEQLLREKIADICEIPKDQRIIDIYADHDNLYTIINNKISLMYSILDFLKSTGR